MKPGIDTGGQLGVTFAAFLFFPFLLSLGCPTIVPTYKSQVEHRGSFELEAGVQWRRCGIGVNTVTVMVALQGYRAMA